MLSPIRFVFANATHKRSPKFVQTIEMRKRLRIALTGVKSKVEDQTIWNWLISRKDSKSREILYVFGE